MLCPKCGYLMSSFDTECPRCAKMPASASPTAPSQPSPTPSPSSGAAGLMGTIGMGLMVLGILGACYFFLFFSTAVQTDFGYINNIGLMGDRQNGILFSFGMAIIGCFLFFIDRSNPNKQPITQKTKNILVSCAIGFVVIVVLVLGTLSHLGNNVHNTFGDPAAAASP